MIKSKAKANKKNITKVEAEQILKEANTHNHSHDHSHKENDRKKIQSTTKPQPAKKAKSIASNTKKTKKVSKK